MGKLKVNCRIQLQTVKLLDGMFTVMSYVNSWDYY